MGDASAAQAEDSANPRSDRRPSRTLPFWHESARHSRVERSPKRKCAAPTASEADKRVCPKCKEDQGSRQLCAWHYTDEPSWRVRPRAAYAHARTHAVHQRVCLSWSFCEALPRGCVPAPHAVLNSYTTHIHGYPVRFRPALCKVDTANFDCREDGFAMPEASGRFFFTCLGFRAWRLHPLENA